MHDLPIFQKPVFRIIDKVLHFIIAVTSLLLIVLMSYYVFSRYVLKTNFRGFEEIATLTAVWLYFCGSANACREQSQISASMINMFIKNKKALSVIDSLCRLVGLIVVGILVYLCCDYLSFNAGVHTKSSLLKIPMYFYHASLVVGFTLMFVYDFCYFIASIKNCGHCLKGCESEAKEENIK